MRSISAIHCPLCASTAVTAYHQDRRRRYFQCSACQLVFVLPADFITVHEEKKVYELHQNSPDDPGYRQFLSRLCVPLCQRLTAGSGGLDFGCGPGPTLSVMLGEHGHPMALYDPFFAPDEAVLRQRYAFVTATEVVEHLRTPAASLELMWQLVAPGGILGIMTKLVRDPAAFARWHYKNDETHVCFFSHPTFTWLATHWQAEIEFIGSDVVLLKNQF